MRKKKKTEKSKLEKKADKLLTPVAKKRNPRCESCGAETQVGHHWIEKSRSNKLRHDMRNIVSLCHKCHFRIHNKYGCSVVGALDVAEVIIKKRGRQWKNEMDRESQESIKYDVNYLLNQMEKLENYLTNKKKSI